MRTIAIVVGTVFLTFGGLAVFIRAVFNAIDSISYDWEEYDHK